MCVCARARVRACVRVCLCDPFVPPNGSDPVGIDPPNGRRRSDAIGGDSAADSERFKAIDTDSERLGAIRSSDSDDGRPSAGRASTRARSVPAAAKARSGPADGVSKRGVQVLW